MSWSFLIVLITYLIVHKVTGTIHAEGRCIWYGQCMEYPPNSGKWLNCYNNTKSVLLEDNSETYNALKSVCPWYINSKPNSTRVCCDLDQINALRTSSLKLAEQQLARCPSCYQNFMNIFCATTCDPNNSLFMNASRLVTVNATTQAIKAVDVYFTNYYTEKFFNSCKDVQDSQEGGKAIDLMCGSNNPCTGQKWLRFMGTPQPGSLAPFELYFLFANVTTGPGIPLNMSARNATLLGCNDMLHGVTCSCSDCPAVCPPVPDIPTSKGTLKVPFILIGIIIGVVGFIIYSIIFVVIVMVSASLTKVKKYQKLRVNRISHSSFCLTDAGRQFEGWIGWVFSWWGCFVANYWFIVIPVVLMVMAVCCLGLKFFNVTTDPVELWSAPSSRARKEKDYFDRHFGPVNRKSQIIITAPNSPGFHFSDSQNYLVEYYFSGMFRQNVLEEILTMQTAISHLNATYKDDSGNDKTVNLTDICFQPLSPDNKNCTIYSVLNYFQNDRDLLNKKVQTVFTITANSSTHIRICTKHPALLNDSDIGISCLAAYGGPVDPNVALGGFETVNGTAQYTLAKAFIITFVINNHLEDANNEAAIAWEKEFTRYLKSYKKNTPHSNLSFSFSSESFVPHVLDRESLADVRTVAISYILMFIYVALFLGSFARKVILAFYGLVAADEKTRRCSAGIIVSSRVGLGLLGVILVGVSVVAALGLLSYMGVKATLIIIEVVPFLVLAVGANNLFILTHAYERRRNFSKPGTPVNVLIGEALGEVAPSILLTSLTETMALLLGAISTIPAVKTFSFFAGTAVFINFLLQITVFTAALSLDSRRIANNRLDFLYCIRVRNNEESEEAQKSLLFLFMKNRYAPFLLHKIVRPVVMYLFGVLFFGMLVGVFNQHIGLSQSIALPKDSYSQEYFDNMSKYLRTGPPVYFVIKGRYDYTDVDNQNKICSSAGCNTNSVGVQIASAALIPEYSRIAEHASIWLDTYFAWIDPRSGCCVVHNRTVSQPVECKNHSNPDCEPCLSSNADFSIYRPSPTEFMYYLPWFLLSNPDTKVCSQGGHAAFHSAVGLLHNKTINASYLMTRHTVLNNSEDYIDALKRAREYSDKFSQTLHHEVFAYSVFYVFYEQILTIKEDVTINLVISLAGVYLMSFLLMGFNLKSSLIVTGTIVLIIVDTIGMMAWVGISVNAVSLVNLVMAVGISVEFCSHIVRWFAHSPYGTRVDRAKDSVTNMGTSVLSGITFTMLLGVLVLMFAKSQVGMYVLMIGFGALHGLVFLPVLLSYIGPFPIEDKTSFHSSTHSFPKDPVNDKSFDFRLMANSPAVNQSKSPCNGVELGEPNENIKLLST